MKKIEGGVTAAQGFEAASAAARIKYEGRTDMALIFSKAPCECAGTFTTNVVKAAPVIWDREMVYSGAAAHAVIVNSGIANACTGKTFEEAEAEFEGQGYGVFKPAVGEAVVELLRPIREQAAELMRDKAYLEGIYKEGAERASYLAEKTLRKVYKKVGFVAR